jgi:transcriptional regulator with XRE-family HTH domain
MDTQATWKALGAAMREAATNADMTQDEVAAGVARIIGRDRPFDQALVSKWYRGISIPLPDQLIAFEQLIGAEPGSYTRHLGYLPATAVATLTVPDAIAADAQLTKRQRDNLTALWRTEVETTLAQRRVSELRAPAPKPPRRQGFDTGPAAPSCRARVARWGGGWAERARRRPPHAGTA